MSESLRRADGPITCVGPVGLDVLIDGDAPLEFDRLLSWTGEGTVRTIAAGSIGYTSVALARLGLPVHLISAVGADVFGREVLDRFVAQGIDTGDIAVGGSESGMAVYLRIFGHRKRPMLLRMPDHDAWPAQFDPATIEGSRAVVVSGALHFPDFARRTLPALFALCRELGIPTFLDPQFATRERADPWTAELAEVIGGVDLLCCDEDEGRQLFGVADIDRMIELAHELGCRIVVIKRGEHGSVLDDGVLRYVQPAAPVGEALASSIGSGDAFLAGLVDSLLAGRSLAEAGRYATAVATVAIVEPEGIAAIDDAVVRLALQQVPPSVPEIRRTYPNTKEFE